MKLRTSESMWWPGITSEIESTRAQCITCRRNAPTQLPLPPVPPPVPHYPFQLISSDYFNYEGHNYLVVIDRYSNWPLIRLCKSESAEELTSCLREFFSTYGVPDEISTDGGPTYMAETTQQFFRTWELNIGLVQLTTPILT